MKLTQKDETEAKQIYLDFMKSYMTWDVKKYDSLLDDDFQFVGSAVDEEFLTRKESTDFFEATGEQINGKIELRNRVITTQIVGEQILVGETNDGYVLYDGEWIYYGRFRVSCLLKNKDNSWKLFHLHISNPDTKAQEGETIGTEQIAAENLQLREAVKRRTTELEHKTHELEIETSLEKVRAIALSMNQPADMLEVCRIISEQLEILKVKDIRNVQTAIIYESKGTYLNYEYYKLHDKSITTEVDYLTHPVQAEFANQMLKSSDAFFSKSFSGDSLEEWVDHQSKTPQFVDPHVKDASSLNYYFHSIGPVALGISTYSPLNEEGLQIFKKFRNVFELAYRRFLDIEAAMAQAREAQIEAALERVRSKTMAMHNSHDVGITVVTLFDEVLKLGLDPSIRCGIGILEGTEHMETRSATSSPNGEVDLKIGMLDMTIHPMLIGLKKAWKRGEKGYSYDYIGDDVTRYYNALNNEPEYPFFVELDTLPEKEFHNSFFFPEGILFAFTLNPLSEEAKKVLDRFAHVFGQTYRRYLDLQKAEAQAREAQIQLGLERVGARAMAMHHSDELAELVDTVFKELTKLDFALSWCIINIIDEKSLSNRVWAINSESGKIPESFYMKFEDYPFHHGMMKAYKERKINWVYEIKGEEKSIYDDYLLNETEFRRVPETVKAQIRSSKNLVCSFTFNNFGGLQTVGDEPLSETNLEILNRFGKVFDQTYTRFNDLKHAEEQAKEAQIEAALERVRSKAMVMHSSDDLAQTVDTFFSELKGLKVTPHRCGVGIINPESRSVKLHTTSATQEDEIKTVAGNMKLSGHPILDNIFKNWKLQKEYYPVLHGDEILEYYKVMNPQVTFPDFAGDDTQYGYFFFFKEGGVYAWTDKELAESDLQIFRRYTSVLSLTYRRYMDLKEAEVRAREAEQQASLDRVRAEIASMRTTDDLEKITPLIWRELTSLSVPFFRCGVFIIDESNDVAHAFLSTPSGESLAALHVKINDTWIENAVKYWRQGKIYHEVWDREQFIAWTKTMMQQGFVENKEQFQAGKEAPESLSLQLLPFSQGMLYVGSKLPLSRDEIDLAKKLADDFGIAYSRYEDFQKLEEANNRKTVELEEARELQLAMLPKTTPQLPNFEIAAYMDTATEVGGDYYDFNVGKDGSLTVVIGDATGHGMKAGTMVTITKSLFNSAASEKNILDTFSKISNVIKSMKFRQLSMCLLLLKIKEDRLSISSAAMPPVLIYRKKTKSVEEILLKGMPLGAMNNFPYSLKQTNLDSGDVILLLSDGLPELTNTNNEMFSYEKTMSEFQSVGDKNPEEIIGHLRKSASEWANNKAPDDDVTFVVIKVK